MASANSDYEQGSMPVEAQSRTFGGFMNLTVYGGSFLAYFLLYPILVFCTPLTWLPSLAIATVLGIILGVVFKLKGGWYAAVIGLSIFLALIAVIFPAFARLVG